MTQRTSQILAARGLCLSNLCPSDQSHRREVVAEWVWGIIDLWQAILKKIMVVRLRVREIVWHQSIHSNLLLHNLEASSSSTLLEASAHSPRHQMPQIPIKATQHLNEINKAVALKMAMGSSKQLWRLRLLVNHSSNHISKLWWCPNFLKDLNRLLERNSWAKKWFLIAAPRVVLVESGKNQVVKRFVKSGRKVEHQRRIHLFNKKHKIQNNLQAEVRHHWNLKWRSNIRS